MGLRGRLFISYILIVFLCLGIVALSSALIVQTQRDRLAIERLGVVARPIYVQAVSLLRGQTTIRDLVDTLAEQSQENNVYILLGNSTGDVVRQISPKNRPLEFPSGQLPHGITQAAQGTLTASNGQKLIYIAYPLTRPAAGLGAPQVETMILATPRVRPAAVLSGLTGPFILGGLSALVISLVAAMLFARSISRPVYRMTAAVQKVAEGKYDEEIPVKGTGEVKRLAVAFNEMVARVKQSQEHLRYFVADVSHQLKSPLTAIQGFSQAMMDGTASDEANRTKATRIIYDEACRMRRQVDELLELARIQSGHMKMEREAVDTGELLHHCGEIFSITATENALKLKIEAAPGLSVYGSFDRLEQVFNNLLDNAIKNSPVGGEVRVTTRPAANSFAEISVADDGPGLPPEMLPHMFERFYRAGGNRAGTGLGLTIAKEIVLAHGGTIEARSSPGAGAEFIVRLPTAVPAQQG